MSTCISGRGEYGSHTFEDPKQRFTCSWCGVLDEAAIYDALEQAEDARDEQERMAMQVRASADEWWGKWERENARAEKAEAALTDLRAKVRREFKACFVPDFGGYDWRDDATIQQLARTLAALVRDAP